MVKHNKSSGRYLVVNNYSVSSESTGQNTPDLRPLVAHVIFRLDFGGLENGLVNLINHMPAERYRHVIICLTDYSDFRFRIRRDDVELFQLHKRPGKDTRTYLALWHLLRQLRPHIVHTRNLPTVDMLLPAMLAGVPYRVHGEHGLDMLELNSSNWKYNLLRRLTTPFVDRYIAVSRDLERWLRKRVRVPTHKLVQIYNGVDTSVFHPAQAKYKSLPIENFASPDSIVIGTVGRLEPIKDQITLIRAFVHLLESQPDLRAKLRLIIVGNGSLLDEAINLLKSANAMNFAWLPGARKDVPQLLRRFDIFALPSRREGISNTILEAMATGLPVVASEVGGNPELVIDGVTGMLLPPANIESMAHALLNYIRNPQQRLDHGRAGRERVEKEFALSTMVERYLVVYDSLLGAGKNRRSCGRRYWRRTAVSKGTARETDSSYR